VDAFSYSCGICIHRVTAAGGRQDCNLTPYARRDYEARETHNCPKFKLGDAQPTPRQQRKLVADSMDSLF
jgi:hypothetical protein